MSQFTLLTEASADHAVAAAANISASGRHVWPVCISAGLPESAAAVEHLATFLKTHVPHSPSETPRDWTAALAVKEATRLTPPKLKTPDGEISVDVVSTVVGVRELDRSMQFYCDVFSCRVVVREADIALLLTPKGFEIYLHQNDDFHDHRARAFGVRHLMWATDNQSDLQRITERLRIYDGAAFSHTVQGVTLLEGTDPDGCRMIVAYPTPRQLPRTLIAERLRG